MSIKETINQIVQNILAIIEVNRELLAKAETERLNKWYQFTVAAYDSFDGDDEEFADYFDSNFESEL